MREAKENEEIVAVSDVAMMLLDKIDALTGKDGNVKERIQWETRRDLLLELLDKDLKGVERISLPPAGRTVHLVARA